MTLSRLIKVSKFLAKTGLLAISAMASLLTASMLILMGSGEEDVLESYSSSIIKLITLQYISFFSIIDLQKLKRPIATTLSFGSIATMIDGRAYSEDFLFSTTLISPRLVEG